MPVADTSFLIALRNEEDAHHARALRAAQRPGPFRIPGVILAEFLLVLWARLKRTHGAAAARRGARQALEDLQAQPVFQIEPAYDADAAHGVYLRHAALSYADAVAIAVAQDHAEDLLTFDRTQVAAARRPRT